MGAWRTGGMISPACKVCPLCGMPKGVKMPHCHDCKKEIEKHQDFSHRILREWLRDARVKVSRLEAALGDSE